MKPLVQLIQVPEIPFHLVMTFVFEELVGAFERTDVDVRVVKSLSQLRDGGIIFLDNASLQDVNLYRPVLEQIAKTCENSVFVLWYWTDKTFMPFKRFIFTGEFYMYFPKQQFYRQRYATYMLQPSYAPLKLRANEDPQKIGTYERIVLRDYCYMGCEYKRDWLSPEFTGIYHVGEWGTYLTYAQRKEIYLSSMFALGFQSQDNIENGHLSQRLFEGLAYGCIVLCENPLAAQFTDGAIVTIANKDDMAAKMRFYKENPILLQEKQAQGYEWCREFGTNHISAQIFLDKIEKDFGLVMPDSLGTTKPEQ